MESNSVWESTMAGKGHIIINFCSNRESRLQSGDRDFKVENRELKVENRDFEVANSDFKVENGDFKVENRDFEVANSDFKVENRDFKVDNHEVSKIMAKMLFNSIAT